MHNIDFQLRTLFLSNCFSNNFVKGFENVLKSHKNSSDNKMGTVVLSLTDIYTSTSSLYGLKGFKTLKYSINSWLVKFVWLMQKFDTCACFTVFLKANYHAISWFTKKPTIIYTFYGYTSKKYNSFLTMHVLPSSSPPPSQQQYKS